jgi:AraC-like DNA-binding protein
MLRKVVPQVNTTGGAAVAGEAGFSNLTYFNRGYRRHFGATPTDV